MKKYRFRLEWIGEFLDDIEARNGTEIMLKDDLRVLNHVQEGRVIAELHEIRENDSPRAVRLRSNR